MWSLKIDDKNTTESPSPIIHPKPSLIKNIKASTSIPYSGLIVTILVSHPLQSLTNASN